MNQPRTLPRKSFQRFSLISRWPLMPRPTNRWIRPMAKQKISRRIGSFSGVNQSALRICFSAGTPKKVCAITSMASPKKLPNRKPQTVVERPHQKNMVSIFFVLCAIFGNFFSATAQPITISRP